MDTFFVTGTLYLFQMLADALPCVSIKQELLFELINREKRSQGNAFRGNDITQFSCARRV